MTTEILRKTPSTGRPHPILSDYAEGCRRFSWEAARARELQGLPEGGTNIAHEALDRHGLSGGPAAKRTAIRWLSKEGHVKDYSYESLSLLSNAFANVLAALGVDAGGKVYTLLGRIPELYVGFFGTLKRRAVFTPLFSAFGPEPIQSRMNLGGCEVLITSEALYRRKVMPIKDGVQSLRHILIVSDTPVKDPDPRVKDFRSLLEAAPTAYRVPATSPEDLALLHFTSGTTGKPKGAMHVHAAVLVHKLTGQYALDMHPEDIYWCTADPGWVTGTSYGIIAPLANGLTMLVDEAEFDAERWYRTLQDQKVTIWYSAPTAIRMLMKSGAELVAKYDLKHLRFLASVGEPLNPEAVRWSAKVFGRPFHDNWWQTETGGIMISNYAAMDVKPGSMGRPLPGIEAAVVRTTADGRVEVITEPDTQGELALRAGWPSMFRGYLNQEEKYRGCFRDGWYLSGDMARRDADGYFWFVGRGDDVIKSAGHLIGPFEVESALIEHPAVAEAGVIGKPDPVLMEVVKAFITLRPGHQWSPELERDVMAHARRRLGPAVAPREIACLEVLPKTRSGKIMRRLLKARELGLPEGDTSTLTSDQ